MPTTDISVLSLEDRPPVHPALVEHLREKFKASLTVYAARSAEDALAGMYEGVGIQSVIEYLDALSKNEENPDEFGQAAEDQGPDTRRPAARARR